MEFVISLFFLSLSFHFYFGFFGVYGSFFLADNRFFPIFVLMWHFCASRKIKIENISLYNINRYLQVKLYAGGLLYAPIWEPLTVCDFWFFISRKSAERENNQQRRCCRCTANATPLNAETEKEREKINEAVYKCTTSNQFWFSADK